MSPRQHLSVETYDALVELFFVALRGMDEAELRCLLNAVIRLMEREVMQQLERDRKRHAPSRN